MKNIVLLGATGSVGANALAVIRQHPEEFRVSGLVAGRGGEKLIKLAREFPEANLALGAGGDADAFVAATGDIARSGRFHSGPDGAAALLADTPMDICVAAVSGTAGMDLTFAAAARETRILLANKEVLVSAGRLFMDAARAGGSEVLPLDSEHTALWQCLEGKNTEEVEKLIITASGGPFRDWSEERMAAATPYDALQHPIWRMGAKISVDSATLANKALELMEAHQLFGFPYDAMDVLVHRQSTVHAMVEMNDGSIIAHLGVCDMRQPISYMLFHPKRVANHLPRLDLAALARLDFEKPCHKRFPLLGIGMEAGRRGGKFPALFNAANEAAVDLFLEGRLTYPGLVGAVESVMANGEKGDFASLAEVADTHMKARRLVEEFAARR